MTLDEEIWKLVNKFRQGESITEDLILHYCDTNFENRIIDMANYEIFQQSGYSLTKDKQALIVVALSVIALKCSDGKTIWPYVKEKFRIFKYHREDKRAEYVIRESLRQYFFDRYPKSNSSNDINNPSKYVSIPLIIAGVTHHWLPDFFDFCLAIYRINLFSARDIKYSDLETEFESTFKKLRANISIEELENDKAATNVIRASKSKSYNLSKYTQCALLTDNNIRGLAHIGATCVNYAIKYLNNETFGIHPFYADAFEEWKNKLNDKERKKYDTEGSSRILIKYYDTNLYLITKNERVGMDCNPSDVKFQLLEDNKIVFESFDVDIDEEETIGGGFRIKSKKWKIEANPLNNLSYRYVSKDTILFDSKDSLYKNDKNYFFNEFGDRVFSGFDYTGELVVISKKAINFANSKLICDKKGYIISEFSANTAGLYIIDGINYRFKTIRNIGLDNSFENNISVLSLLNNKQFKLYKSSPTINLETELKKEELLLRIDDQISEIDFSKMVEYPPLENGIRQYVFLLPKLSDGFHSAAIITKKENKILDNQKYEFITDSNYNFSVSDKQITIIFNSKPHLINYKIGDSFLQIKTECPGLGISLLQINPQVVSVSANSFDWLEPNSRLCYKNFDVGNPILYITGSQNIILKTSNSETEIKLFKSKRVNTYEANIGPILSLRDYSDIKTVELYIYSNDSVSLFYLDLVTYVDLSKSIFEYNQNEHRHIFKFHFDTTNIVTCKILDINDNCVFGPIAIQNDVEFFPNNLVAFEKYKVILKEKETGFLVDKERTLATLTYSFADINELIGKKFKLVRIAFEGRDGEKERFAYTPVSLEFIAPDEKDHTCYIGKLKHEVIYGTDNYYNKLGKIRVRVEGEFINDMIWIYLSELEEDEFLFYDNKRNMIFNSTENNAATHNMPVVTRASIKFEK